MEVQLTRKNSVLWRGRVDEKLEQDQKMIRF